MSKRIEDMTDTEVLDAAAGLGPAIIGQELYDRAQAVKKQNPDGHIGPAILATEPLEAAPLTEKKLAAAADAAGAELVAKAKAPVAKPEAAPKAKGKATKPKGKAK